MRSMSRMSASMLVVAGFWLIPNAAAADERISQLFESRYDETSPGIAVAVVKNDEIVYSSGFGSANLEYDIPIAADTVFHAASLSKQFTVFAILKLQDEGLLSIEDDIRKYLPEVPDFGQTIRLRHLMTHSSGLREQWRLLEMAGWRLDDVITDEHVMMLVERQSELNFEPGTKFRYSNTGFTLLAKVVEQVTGRTFAQYTQETIFEPLEMSNTQFYDDHEIIVRNRAYSYQKSNDQLMKSRLNFSQVGPTSLFTTAEDLSRWAVNFNTTVVGSEAIFELMRQPGRKPDGSTVSYAMGQFVGEYRGHPMIYHSGSDAGYRAYFARFPEDDLAFVVLANASYINARSELFKVVDLFFEPPDVRTAQTQESPAAFEHDPATFIEQTVEQLSAFEGSYWDPEENGYRHAVIQDGQLYYTDDSGTEIALAAVADGQFKMLDIAYDISVNFKTNDLDEPIMEVYSPDLMWLWLIKVQDKEVAAPTPAEDAYVGEYFCDDLGTSYHIVRRDGGYALSHDRLGEIALSQIHKGLFTSSNRNFWQIRFQRNGDDVVTGFSVKNNGIESIAFVKR